MKCGGARRDAETQNPEAERKADRRWTTCFQERKAVGSHVSSARFEKTEKEPGTIRETRWFGFQE